MKTELFISRSLLRRGINRQIPSLQPADQHNNEAWLISKITPQGSLLNLLSNIPQHPLQMIEALY